MNFTEFHKKVKELDVNLELKKAVELTKHNAIDLNREQLRDSKDSKGKTLRTYKSRRYALRKGRRNADLFLKGDFQNAFFGDVIPDTNKVILSIDSTDKKRDWLVEGTSRMEPFGEDIFGLTEGNNDEWQDKNVKKELTSQIKTQLGIS